jgi:hypothetical protein
MHRPHSFARPLGPREIDWHRDGELATYVGFAALQWLHCRRWSLDRRPWTRSHRQAMRLVGERLTQHGGPPLILCERCGECRATTHSAYGEGAELRFAHFCVGCARKENPGWFGVATAENLPTPDFIAACAGCGRHGTIAYAAWHKTPLRIDRYCRRCWPAAHRRLQSGHWRGRDEGFEAWAAQAGRRAAADEDVGFVDQFSPVPVSLAWHWTVALSSTIRDEVMLFRYRRVASQR